MDSILFLLVPKRDVVFLPNNCSVQFALDVMEENAYSAIPIINEKGRYVGTLTEGDLLWEIKNNPGMNFDNTRKFTLKDIKRKRKVQSAGINEDLGIIIELSKTQNFVPITDDDGVFIGIITRQEVIDYLLKKDSIIKEEAI
ncbi:CBS domain-containing protein [Alkalibacter mobilis]|uniref:CBS domain-containing protein n=1 Tax=Alkalibacter mobilis TaxID=2787712 RepID=UPI001CED0B80|nr:CBS domain-containing protein [Alkalibacter mobilis]